MKICRVYVRNGKNRSTNQQAGYIQVWRISGQIGFLMEIGYVWVSKSVSTQTIMYATFMRAVCNLKIVGFKVGRKWHEIR
jgi:hypothetical protein